MSMTINPATDSISIANNDLIIETKTGIVTMHVSDLGKLVDAVTLLLYLKP